MPGGTKPSGPETVPQTCRGVGERHGSAAGTAEDGGLREAVRKGGLRVETAARHVQELSSTAGADTGGTISTNTSVC
jgi:hypothetical protein